MNDPERQQRETRQRKLVLDSVSHRLDHPSAEDIYQEVHEADPRVSKATVYRNLKLLAERGEIRHVKVPGADRFDSTLAHHYHLLCTKCRQLIDVPLPYEDEKDRQVAEATGYRIKRHLTVFEGLCPACQGLSGASDFKE